MDLSDDPKLSFDVYIEMDPSDTNNYLLISVDDVKNTIKTFKKL